MNVALARLLAAPAALSLLLVASSVARADILPAGMKGARNSIVVEGDVPAGKAVLVANTFFGATAVKPGAVVPISWHPLDGPMHIALVDAKEAAKVPDPGERQSAKAAKEIAEKGVTCGEPFRGVRSLPRESPAAEIRVVYKVTVTGATCVATLLRTEQIDKAGAVVDAPRGAPFASAPASASAPAPSSSSAPAPAEPLPAPPKSGCGACAIGAAPADAGPWVAFALALAAALFARRRRGQGLAGEIQSGAKSEDETTS